MMKICHMSSVHGRSDPRIRLKECCSLLRAGYEVFFLVADGLGCEDAEGLHIVDAGKRPDSRRERFLFSARRMLAAAREIDADLYHFHDPELIPAGLALARRGKIVVYDSHEDLPRQLLSKPYIGGFKARVASIVAKIGEDWAVGRLDAVIAATTSIGMRHERHARRLVVVNNYPSLEELGLVDLMPRTREARACYVGGISLIRGGRELAAAARLCHYPFELAGPVDSSALKEELFGGDSPLIYRGVLDRRKVADFMCASSVGLVTFLPLPNHLEALPTKLFEYMAAGIPVVASNFPLWKEIVETGGCGLCVDPRKPREIAEAIDRILGDPPRAAAMGAAGRRLVLESRNWKAEEKKLLSLYEDLRKIKC